MAEKPLNQQQVSSSDQGSKPETPRPSGMGPTARQLHKSKEIHRGVVRYQLKSGCFAMKEQLDEPRSGWSRGRPYREETIGNVCVSELGGLGTGRCCFTVSLL